MTSIDPSRRSFNCGPMRSSRWPTVSVRTPSWPARLISVEYPALRKRRARIAGGAPDHLAVAAAHDDVGEIGESFGRSDIASRWPWPLMRAISTSACSSITGDRRSSGPAIRISSSRASCPTSAARRVGEQRQPLGQIGARGDFGMRNEVDQNAVEQIDVIGPEIRGPLQEQFGDPARSLGAGAWDRHVLTISSSPGISEVATVINTLLKPAASAGLCRNLGRLGEGRVRFETRPRRPQNRASRPRGPCRIGRKPLYQPQLMVLIRSRIESGPLRDPLFFIT